MDIHRVGFIPSSPWEVKVGVKMGLALSFMAMSDCEPVFLYCGIMHLTVTVCSVVFTTFQTERKR